MYRYTPSVPSNYKVAVLYKNGYVSTTNHKSIKSACDEMRALLFSWYNDMNFSQGKVWENIINVWIE